MEASAPPFCQLWPAQAARCGNKVYIYGEANGGYTGLWSYDMDTNTWAQETPAGTPPEQAAFGRLPGGRMKQHGICYMTGGATVS
jgi:hypothetical protein